MNLVNDNLFEWHVRLHRIDSESDLAADMREQGVSHILLHITFPDNFPFAPPFMRVISPRIERGFVMEGGAICMELLTPRGWASAYTVEAIIMQFAASIVKGQVSWSFYVILFCIDIMHNAVLLFNLYHQILHSTKATNITNNPEAIAVFPDMVLYKLNTFLFIV